MRAYPGSPGDVIFIIQEGWGLLARGEVIGRIGLVQLRGDDGGHGLSYAFGDTGSGDVADKPPLVSDAKNGTRPVSFHLCQGPTQIPALFDGIALVREESDHSLALCIPEFVYGQYFYGSNLVKGIIADRDIAAKQEDKNIEPGAVQPDLDILPGKDIKIL
jgi:hypothetical protein